MVVLYEDRYGNKLVLNKSKKQIYAKNAKGKIVNPTGFRDILRRARRAGKAPKGRIVKRRRKK